MRNLKLVIGIFLLLLLIAGTAQAAKDREQELQIVVPISISEESCREIGVPIIDIIGHELSNTYNIVVWSCSDDY